MKSTHGMAKFQRGVTGSEYGTIIHYLDHIALVLRNSKDEVLLFESNSDTGVAITFWKDMLRFKWYEAAEKLVCNDIEWSIERWGMWRGERGS